MQVPGQSRPLEGVLEFETLPDSQKEISSAKELSLQSKQSLEVKMVSGQGDLERENARLRKELNQLKVKEVERQQTYFGVGIND